MASVIEDECALDYDETSFNVNLIVEGLNWAVLVGLCGFDVIV